MTFRSEEKFVEIPEVSDDGVRNLTIRRIEELTLQLIKEISSRTFPKLIYKEARKGGRVAELEDSVEQFRNRQTSARNLSDSALNPLTSFDSSKSLSWLVDDEETPQNAQNPVNKDLESEKDSDTGRSITVDFRRKQSRKNLALLVTLMSHVHKMLINRTSKTRRSLYYELQSERNSARLAKNQRILDNAVNHVASLLECPPWQLGFTATSKGLVCGDLSLTFSKEDLVSCEVAGGVLIPQNVNRVTSARTSARYVLVVEKDAVFQRLIGEECTQYLNCILVTGKGYPDINTRMLVSFLGNKLKLPVYVLVDADPFGIEIMCIYRYGSATRSREDRQLAFPGARWIGIHPSEFSALGLSSKPLAAPDKAKIAALKSREYVDETILDQLQLLRTGKVDIEAVAGLSSRFLTTVYLSSKITADNYL
ncbi:meiotic recombination protein W68 [Neodiprion virginianus]|uniref:meiotic recombination protein W68 n=1 Tax=Neodiprion virginianus TaxID=2961670 RepID=UPI001EE7388F|nr:meiotic recombination protein W68 [Neodiprion virginianus]